MYAPRISSSILIGIMFCLAGRPLVSSATVFGVDYLTII
jgi:hypothetical protein